MGRDRTFSAWSETVRRQLSLGDVIDPELAKEAFEDGVSPARFVQRMGLGKYGPGMPGAGDAARRETEDNEDGEVAKDTAVERRFRARARRGPGGGSYGRGERIDALMKDFRTGKLSKDGWKELHRLLRTSAFEKGRYTAIDAARSKGYDIAGEEFEFGPGGTIVSGSYRVTKHGQPLPYGHHPTRDQAWDALLVQQALRAKRGEGTEDSEVERRRVGQRVAQALNPIPSSFVSRPRTVNEKSYDQHRPVILLTVSVGSFAAGVKLDATYPDGVGPFRASTVGALASGVVAGVAWKVGCTRTKEIALAIATGQVAASVKRALTQEGGLLALKKSKGGSS
jgi:hypothetical protein